MSDATPAPPSYGGQAVVEGVIFHRLMREEMGTNGTSQAKAAPLVAERLGVSYGACASRWIAWGAPPPAKVLGREPCRPRKSGEILGPY